MANTCIGTVKKTGKFCGCKAKYDGKWCGRHVQQSGNLTKKGDELIDCFVCGNEKVLAVTMPCCGQKICGNCTLKSHAYTDTCVFCRNKLKIFLTILVKKA